MTNREIAQRRGISLDAVKFHVSNAVAKLGVENRKALKRWRGSPKDSALSMKDNEMDDAATIVGLGQVSRSVGDIQQAETWYQDVLGLQHLYTFDKLAFFDIGGTRLMLSEGEELQASESLLYLRVADIDATYDALRADGVEFIQTPHMIHKHDDGTEEWMAFFKDPDDRPLAIMSAINPAT